MWYHVIPCDTLGDTMWYNVDVFGTSLFTSEDSSFCWTSGRWGHGDLDHVGISSRWSCAWRAQATRRFFSLGDRKIIWKINENHLENHMENHLENHLENHSVLTADDNISTVICHHGVWWHQPAERWWIDESYAVCFAPRQCLPQVAWYSLGPQGKGVILRGIPNVLAIWTSDQFGICFALLPFPWWSLMSCSHSQRGHVWIHTFR